MNLFSDIRALVIDSLTAMTTEGALPEGLDLSALADAGATTVVYMGKRTFAGLVARLVATGLPADTPALLAEAVSTDDQRLTRTTITELAALLADSDSKAPGLILYGPLADD